MKKRARPLSQWSDELPRRGNRSATDGEAFLDEIWAHFLAYNLTRKVMAQAALDQGVHPRQSSFLAAVQTLNEFRLVLVTATSQQGQARAQVIFAAIVSIASATDPIAANRAP